MPVADYTPAEIKRAYELLGVPETASAHVIRQTYRRMAKRWHPDIYPTGTPTYAEATQMMALINEAYSRIEHAPLRYWVRPREAPQPTTADAAHVAEVQLWHDTWPTDRVEFWIRFVCGAAFGLLPAVNLVILGVSQYPRSVVFLLVSGAILVIGCGLGAARYGDKFWYEVVLSRWRW